MIGSNDPTGSTPLNRLQSPEHRGLARSLQLNRSSLNRSSLNRSSGALARCAGLLIGPLVGLASTVVLVPSASAQTTPANPPTTVTSSALPQTGVRAPGPTNVTSQIVDSSQVGAVITNTASAPPPTNSPGVVVTPVNPTSDTVETTVQTTSPTSKAPAKRRTTTAPPKKKEPAATTTASPTTAAPSEASDARSTSAIPESAWAALRKCESGGNYKTNTGNGYYGAYQFAAGTWRRLGYAGLPHEATPATQDEAARRLQAKSGWGQWPACTRKLGLR